MIGDVKLNYKRILMGALKFFAVIIAILIGLKVAVFFIPFLIAYIISKMIKRPVNFLNLKLKFPRVLAVIVSMLLFLAIVGGVMYLFCNALFRELISLSGRTQYIFPTLYNNISLQLGRFNFFFNNLDISSDIIEGIETSALSIVNNLLTSLAELINKAGNGAINVVVNFPTILIYIIITVLSTFFISCDSKFISESLEKYLPSRWIKKASNISNGLLSSLVGYLKAQGILITITFCELLIGFCIFDVDYAVILAITIAIIDALPILGTGTVLIPWGIVLLVMGNYTLAFCIIGLYLFILVIRQLIEPKIVGRQIGIYPLLTLIAMYTGVRFFGLIGVIIGPIVLIILKSVFGEFYEKGVLKELFEN